MEKSKNFSIPKLKTVKSKGNLRNVEINSRDAIEIINIIKRNCLSERYKEDWTIEKVSLVDNSELQAEYSCKKKEFKENGRNPRELADHYGFLFVKDTVLMSKMIKEGLKAKKSVFNPLGDNEFGIYICKYPDVQLKLPSMKHDESAYIIIFKYMLGRCKAILPQGNITGEPAPNYDSATSSVATLINDPTNILFPRSQVYLYEYDDDALPINRPRHCLPVAVVSFNKATNMQTKTSSTSSLSNTTSSSSSPSTFGSRRRASDQGLLFRPGTYGARNQALKRTSLDQPLTPLMQCTIFNMEESIQPSNNPLIMKEGLNDTYNEKPGMLKPKLMTDTGVKSSLPIPHTDLITKPSDPRRAAHRQSIYTGGPSTNAISPQPDLPQKIGEKPLHPFMRKKKKATVTLSTGQSQMRKNNLLIEKLDYSVSKTSKPQNVTEEEDIPTNLPVTSPKDEKLQPTPAQTNMEEMIKKVNKLFGKAPSCKDPPIETLQEVGSMIGPHSGYDNTENISSKTQSCSSPTKIIQSPETLSPIKQEAKKDTNYVQSLAAQLQNLGDLQDVILKFNFTGDVSPQKVNPSTNSQPNKTNSMPDTFDHSQTNYPSNNFERQRQIEVLDSSADGAGLESYQQSNKCATENSNMTVNCYGDIDYRQKQAPSQSNPSTVQYTRIQNDPRRIVWPNAVPYSAHKSDRGNTSSNGTSSEETGDNNSSSHVLEQTTHSVISTDHSVEHPITNVKQSATNLTVHDQFVFSSEYSVASSQLSISKNKYPVTSGEHPKASSENRSASSEHPVTKSENPSTSSEHPVTISENHSADSEHPIATSEHPVTNSDNSVARNESNIQYSQKLAGLYSSQKQCEKWLKENRNVQDKDTKKMNSKFQPKMELVDLKKVAEASLTNCRTCIMERDDLAAYISNKKHKSVKKYLEHIDLFKDNSVKGNEEKMEPDSIENKPDGISPAKRRNSYDDQDVDDAKRLKSIFESSSSDSKFSWLSDQQMVRNEPSAASAPNDCSTNDLHDDDDDDDYSNELIIDMRTDLNVSKPSSSDIPMCDLSADKQSTVSESSSKVTLKTDTNFFVQEEKQTFKELEDYHKNFSIRETTPSKTKESNSFSSSSDVKNEVNMDYTSGVKELESSPSRPVNSNRSPSQSDHLNQLKDLLPSPVDLNPVNDDKPFNSIKKSYLSSSAFTHDSKENTVWKFTHAPNSAENTAMEFTHEQNSAENTAIEFTPAQNSAENTKMELTTSPNSAENTAMEFPLEQNSAENTKMEFTHAQNSAENTATEFPLAQNSAKNTSKEYTPTQNSEENTAMSSKDSTLNKIGNEDITESQNSYQNSNKKMADVPKASKTYEERLRIIKLKYSCPTFPLPPASNKYTSVKQEVAIIRNCLENLPQNLLCNEKSDAPDEETLRSALLHVETELIMELQDQYFLYRPNQRLPSSLLFDYEKNCLYATGDCFMYLNTFLTKQLYKSLLKIKHDVLDAYKEKQNLSSPSSRLSYLADHLNYLLNKRKILIRTLTGSVKPNRLVHLEKAREYYILSIEHMNQSVKNYDNSQMKNMNRLLSELTEHTCRIRSELES